jgi:hypothetical protein
MKRIKSVTFHLQRAEPPTVVSASLDDEEHGVPDDGRMMLLAKLYAALAKELVDWQAANGTAQPANENNTSLIWQIHSLVGAHRGFGDEHPDKKEALRVKMSEVARKTGVVDSEFLFSEWEVEGLELLMFSSLTKPLAPYNEPKNTSGFFPQFW